MDVYFIFIPYKLHIGTDMILFSRFYFTKLYNFFLPSILILVYFSQQKVGKKIKEW